MSIYILRLVFSIINSFLKIYFVDKVLFVYLYTFELGIAVPGIWEALICLHIRDTNLAYGRQPNLLKSD